MSRLLPVLLALTGCQPGPSELVCSARLSDAVSTVVDLGWEAPPNGVSWVEFGVDGEPPLTTPKKQDDAPSFALVGVPPNMDVQWEGITEVDGRRYTCQGTTQTGSPPQQMPEVTVTISDGERIADSPRFLLGAYYDLFGQSYVVALDRHGRVVWYGPHEDDGINIEAELSADGNGVLFNRFGKDNSEDNSYIYHASFDGDLLEQRRTPLAHHMFVQLPGGDIGYQQLLTYDIDDPETGEPETWAGDGIAILSQDGTVTPVFSVWDWLTPSWNDRMHGFSIYGDLDWTHGNALKYDPVKDTWLLSLAHAADVFEIDRETETPLRIFGRDGYHDGDGPPFYYQHDPTLLGDDRLLVFETDPQTNSTGAAEFLIDDEAENLSPVWSYDGDITSLYLGQARRLDNGDTFVNFGQGATMREVTPDGEVVWEMVSDGHDGMAQFQLLDSFYVDL